MKIAYRPEIDGLRALAVFSVIFYHADLLFGAEQLLKGGFFGVDIFFVISGFLITAIIQKEYRATGTFSYQHFYERRVRRLLPALFTVILVSLPFAWLYLLPKPFIDYAWSLLSSIGFVSNFYWDTSLQQYAAESALIKPFLNTWSLAVEEQYYLIFPLLLLALFKATVKYQLVIFFLLMLVSLQFAQWLSIVDHSASFYLLPSRFWELLVGALLALSIYSPSPSGFLNYQKPAAMVGLGLILLSIIGIPFNKSHPGYVTLIPVLGTVLLIWGTQSNHWVTRLLSAKWLVWLGLLSYSLYLWHYPIFAFGRIINPDPELKQKIVWILLTLILSTISYYLIEKPFRQQQRLSLKWLVVSLSSMAAMIIISASLIIYHHGFVQRVPDIIQKIAFGEEKAALCQKDDFPCELLKTGQQEIVLLGDSHMALFERSMYDWAEQHHFKLTSLNLNACPFVPGMERKDKDTLQTSSCHLAVQQKRLDYLNQGEKKIIVIGGRLPLYLNESVFDNQQGGVEADRFEDIFTLPDTILASKTERQQALKQHIQQAIQQLLDNGHTIILIYPIPEAGWDIPKKLALMLNLNPQQPEATLLANNPITTSYSVYQQRTQSSYAILDELEGDNLFRVYPDQLFCDKQSGRCRTHDDQNSYYRDDDHLSRIGTNMLFNQLLTLPPFTATQH